MSSLSHSDSQSDAPTTEDCAADCFPPALSFSDKAEIDAWYQATETPMSDAELDAQWEAEMIRRDNEQTDLVDHWSDFIDVRSANTR